MKQLYLILSAIGFVAPNIWVAKVSIDTGNWLLWLDPSATIADMFGNPISTAFIVDLLVVVLVFMIWTYHESKRHNMQKPYILWLLTFMFGMAGTFPLFLYQRAKHLAK